MAARRLDSGPDLTTQPGRRRLGGSAEPRFYTSRAPGRASAYRVAGHAEHGVRTTGDHRSSTRYTGSPGHRQEGIVDGDGQCRRRPAGRVSDSREGACPHPVRVHDVGRRLAGRRAGAARPRPGSPRPPEMSTASNVIAGRSALRRGVAMAPCQSASGRMAPTRQDRRGRTVAKFPRGQRGDGGPRRPALASSAGQAGAACGGAEDAAKPQRRHDSTRLVIRVTAARRSLPNPARRRPRRTSGPRGRAPRRQQPVRDDSGGKARRPMRTAATAVRAAPPSGPRLRPAPCRAGRRAWPAARPPALGRPAVGPMVLPSPSTGTTSGRTQLHGGRRRRSPAANAGWRS
jgi:hypothetical protein